MAVVRRQSAASSQNDHEGQIRVTLRWSGVQPESRPGSLLPTSGARRPPQGAQLPLGEPREAAGGSCGDVTRPCAILSRLSLRAPWGTVLRNDPGGSTIRRFLPRLWRRVRCNLHRLNLAPAPRLSNQSLVG